MKETANRYAIALLSVIMVCLLAVPAMADYTADKPLTVYEQGTIQGVIDGGLTYTIGDSYYSEKLMNDHDCNVSTDDADHYVVTLVPDMPDGARIESARLYIYWTWSAVDTDTLDNAGGWDTGVDAQFGVTINGEMLPLDRAYSDSKGYGMYNYPSGTYCYDVTDLVASTNVVDAKNSYPYTGDDLNTSGNDDQYACIQGIGLVVVYENPIPPVDPDGAHPIEYWIAEGSDITYSYWSPTRLRWSYGITPDDCITPVTFSGVKTSVLLESATLTTVVPAGDSLNNKLYFNDYIWEGLWNCNPYRDLSWTQTDVTDCLVDGDNIAKLQNGRYEPNGGDRMMAAANAFLVVEYRGSEGAV